MHNIFSMNIYIYFKSTFFFLFLFLKKKRENAHEAATQSEQLCNPLLGRDPPVINAGLEAKLNSPVEVILHYRCTVKCHPKPKMSQTSCD